MGNKRKSTRIKLGNLTFSSNINCLKPYFHLQSLVVESGNQIGVLAFLVHVSVQQRFPSSSIHSILLVLYSFRPTKDITLSFLVCPTKDITFPFLKKVLYHMNIKNYIFSLHLTHKTKHPKISNRPTNVTSFMERRE